MKEAPSGDLYCASRQAFKLDFSACFKKPSCNSLIPLSLLLKPYGKSQQTENNETLTAQLNQPTPTRWLFYEPFTPSSLRGPWITLHSFPPRSLLQFPDVTIKAPQGHQRPRERYRTVFIPHSREAWVKTMLGEDVNPADMTVAYLLEDIRKRRYGTALCSSSLDGHYTYVHSNSAFIPACICSLVGENFPSAIHRYIYTCLFSRMERNGYRPEKNFLNYYTAARRLVLSYMVMVCCVGPCRAKKDF
jgi:hypothetical protein